MITYLVCFGIAMVLLAAYLIAGDGGGEGDRAG